MESSAFISQFVLFTVFRLISFASDRDFAGGFDFLTFIHVFDIFSSVPVRI